jgi:hypothetical protein
MKNTIKIIETGYYHPSQANWSYHVFMIIDKTGARLYTATFGGERRIKAFKDENKAKRLDYLSVGKGSGTEYKWRDIKDLGDIEFYNGKNWPR